MLMLLASFPDRIAEVMRSIMSRQKLFRLQDALVSFYIVLLTTPGAAAAIDEAKPHNI
jgi:hypothetical protein